MVALIVSTAALERDAIDQCRGFSSDAKCEVAPSKSDKHSGQQLASGLVPAFIMLLAFVPAILTSGIVRRDDAPTSDAALQNHASAVYYCGFLLTIIGLVYALGGLQLPNTEATLLQTMRVEIGAVLNKSGAALGSTVVGAGVRILMLLFLKKRRDPARSDDLASQTSRVVAGLSRVERAIERCQIESAADGQPDPPPSARQVFEAMLRALAEAGLREEHLRPSRGPGTWMDRRARRVTHGDDLPYAASRVMLRWSEARLGHAHMTRLADD
ncbi:MAG: hypothetical protein HQL40_02380 [Alphaproteobacteria bacterium]|nr:hypothetical protein [Alphaproteobacteria bacterium]